MIFLEDIDTHECHLTDLQLPLRVPTPPRGPAGETAHMYDDAIEGRTPPPRLARWLVEHGDAVFSVFAFLCWTALAAFVGYWLAL